MVSFDSRNEATSVIVDSLSSCISCMSVDLYSNYILDTLAHIKLHESADVSKKYSVILGTVQKLHDKAKQKLVSWTQSGTSFAAIADAMGTGISNVSCMQEVDTCVINLCSGVGLQLDSLVQRYISECKVSDVMSRAEMLTSIQLVKSSIYRYKVDFTDRTKLSGSTTNILFTCVLSPAEIIFEYFAYILTTITTVLQGDGMPAVYESYSAYPTTVATSDPKLNSQSADKTSVFATEAISNAEGLISIIKTLDRGVNSMSQQTFARFTRDILVSYSQLLSSQLADEFK